ncbi:RTA1 like protein-domain-containing protein [Emericellopsis atlantica]|uniref:RTA1 like protein-domain-containing protein n=1 Tax=Emericellopsis atlantica TaxID=2614577 RepID=A0A9P7ZG61_9HYPO|nr:RTA1 like protein-domain-containing protein [Emericellopsis atlantica]KAG9250970.1 RTA1 like protein-domain-containing protein [Emericellopsis atlantica]
MADGEGQYPPELQYIVVFGPDSNRTLELCPLEWSVYKYRPSLPANISILVLLGIAALTHIYLGFRWKCIWFAVCMVLGSVYGMVGYVGRITMHANPFRFDAFLMQVVCVTGAPVFYTAAIYVTLSQVINYFGREFSRLQPKLVYWIFIPADILCLVLQAAGGALSTISSGSSQTGIDIAMAGLILQVVVIFCFCALFADYMIRFFRSKHSRALERKEKLFFVFLGAAIVLIEGRCIFRCYELSQGYTDSDLITNEALFIGLEGV